MPPKKIVIDETMVSFHDFARTDDVGADVTDKGTVNGQPRIGLEQGWFEFKTPIVWGNVFYVFAFHAIALYGLFTISMLQHKLLTIWGIILFGISGFGMTAGVHRYWCHRSYKANLPLRIILLLSHIAGGQNSVVDWVRDHRAHHKFTETDADPYNSNRGFFFSHVGWIMMKKHPEILRRGRQIDMTDVLADPVVQFGEKYFRLLKMLLCFVLPIFVPVYYWNEDWYSSIIMIGFVRYVGYLNVTWSVNSFAHIWGHRSYDKSIAPTDNIYVSIISLGEGWHNYHHVFPWDYKTAEWGDYHVNLTTMWIDFFAKIGWAYDLKKASASLVKKVAENKGDGSRSVWRECKINESQKND